jgi:hypothetical protein
LERGLYIVGYDHVLFDSRAQVGMPRTLERRTKPKLGMDRHLSPDLFAHATECADHEHAFLIRYVFNSH